MNKIIRAAVAASALAMAVVGLSGVSNATPRTTVADTTWAAVVAPDNSTADQSMATTTPADSTSTTPAIMPMDTTWA